MKNKKVAIDCRMIEHSGIGTFIRGILDELHAFEEFQFLLIGNTEKLSKYEGKGIRILENNFPIFSINEKLRFPVKEINYCDAFIAPNFNLPSGIKIPILTIIHDVLFLDHPEIVKSWLGRLIRSYFMKRAIRLSTIIFTVSKFSKKRIEKHFNKTNAEVIYNGVPHDVIDFRNKNEYYKKEDYFLYVGNLKEQKGIITLLKAFQYLGEGYKLKIVGRKERLRTADYEVQTMFEQKSFSNIEFTGFLERSILLETIAKAKALIQPSIYEGFGLPPLEALALGTSCILSDIKVFKEVYEKEPVSFFKTGDVEDLCAIIKNFETKFELSTTVVNKYRYKDALIKLLNAVI